MLFNRPKDIIGMSSGKSIIIFDRNFSSDKLVVETSKIRIIECYRLFLWKEVLNVRSVLKLFGEIATVIGSNRISLRTDSKFIYTDF